jgi:DNA-binding NtrC family response regulator
MHLATPHLRPDFLERLMSHTWPGNVRELANFMRRVLTLSGTVDLDASCFELEFHGSSKSLASSYGQPQSQAPTAGTPIRQVERLHLESTLALTDGNRTHAAEMLGISLRTLRNKIREYGLPPRRYA